MSLQGLLANLSALQMDLSRGPPGIVSFCTAGHILTPLKSSCHRLPFFCRKDLPIGMKMTARKLLSENKMQIYDTVSII